MVTKKDFISYMTKSIRMHPKQNELKIMMERAGFDLCEFYNLTQGIVAVHKGYKI